MTDSIGTIYIENETKLSWLIELGVVCEKNQVGQRHDLKIILSYHDQSDKVCDIWQKPDKTTWQII